VTYLVAQIARRKLMLMSRDEASREAREIAVSEANLLGIQLSQDAVNRLAMIPPNFMPDVAQIDVQISEMRREIHDILDHASTFRRPIVDETLIRNILGTWACHYLWFC
jgi:hypothetical protein